MPSTSIHHPYLAHARVRENGSYVPHDVETHLREVALRAREFATAFGSGPWAYLAGLWHDLGKYHPEFQRYIARATGIDAAAHLEDAPGRVDHSTLGAVHAVDRLGLRGTVLAYLIAGHHAGLPDWNSEEQGPASLLQRLERNRPRLPAVLSEPIPSDIIDSEPPVGGSPGGSVALWIRMLFSSLVDADFLDTEAFLNADDADARARFPALAELRGRFDTFMQNKEAEIRARGSLSAVNRVRAEVLRHCREQATQTPGLFSLTVPTGGGKTLSSFAFALEHARVHGKRRIIYVIPYTSIIEQTADVFREALGNEAVVEHHTALDSERETRESRLASENWDAPVVVTTSVQFFESLFAARTSRVRKLHNIADSVVVLDEAQLLPPDFLQPILSAISDLAAHYGVTFVLCTATQPALEEQRSVDFHFQGLTGVREIIERPDALHEALRRVDLVLPADLRTPESWEDVAANLLKERQVLCIVNRRDDCRTLFRLLDDGTAVHLSALMCGEHRSRVIRRIGEALGANQPIRVVSTQLVEAGVDLDFPVVFRALAGLDSIAQAAGRCNREGRRERGRVEVFVPPRPAPAGHLRMAEEGGRRSLEARADDPLTPERFRDYFRELFWKYGNRLDRHRILEDLTPGTRLQIRFRTAANKFRMIDDAYRPVVVEYDNDSLLSRLRHAPPGRDLLRRLQRYTVSVPCYLHERLVAAGEVEEVHPGIFLQASTRLYHADLGLLADEQTFHEAADLVV